MFLFTKSRKDGSDYRKLEDIETRDHLPPHTTEKVYQDDRRLDYRAAFYGLSVAYVLTVILGLSLWKFGPNTDTSGSAPSKIDSMQFFRSDIESKPLTNVLVPRNQQILFQKADEFEAKNDPKGLDDPWASLIPSMTSLLHLKALTNTPCPAGKGFVEIENKQYCISMFHQLHCIVCLPSTSLSKSPTNYPTGNYQNRLRGRRQRKQASRPLLRLPAAKRDVCW
jgi:hypothetical protein